jgi:hypothetical protein
MGSDCCSPGRKIHEEKTRPGFPTNAVKFCLEYAGISVNQLDAIVFYDKAAFKFERLLETYYAYAPKGLSSFMMSMPVWIKEKLFLKKLIYEALDSIEKVDRKKIKLLFPSTTFLMQPAPFILRDMRMLQSLLLMVLENGLLLLFAKGKAIRSRF